MIVIGSRPTLSTPPTGTGLPRARRFLGAATVLLLVASMLTWSGLAAAPVAEAAVRTPFITTFSTQENGAIALTGNSQLTCPTATATCTAARATAATGSGVSNVNNNDYGMVVVDADSDASTANSSSADLALPTGATVLSAKLVWGARLGAATTGPTAAIKVRAPGATGYTSYTGSTTIYALTDNPYQSSLDVTSLVLARGNGTYWVADMAAATGVDKYAGWSLVVAYRDPSQPLRDLRIYEGFADVSNSTGNTNVSIPISGFLTPPTGPVRSAIGVVAWEGDRGSVGDSLALGSTVLSDATRPANNFFDSAISDNGANITGRNPANSNNFGVDIGRISSTNVLGNASTSTTLNLTTGGETYYPGVITTQIDLFTPTFNTISKTVTNLSGNAVAVPGDTLQYQLTFTNTGSDFADRTVIGDALPAGVTYVPGSLVVTANSGVTGTQTDTAGDDIGEYAAATRTVTVRSGSGATTTTGGTIAPNQTSTVQFRVTVDRAAAGTTISNTPTLSYQARTINKPYTFTGNAVATPVRALADLAVTSTAGSGATSAGSTAVFTATVTNDGPNAATSVVTTQSLPTGTTYSSAATPAGTSCAAEGQTVTCTTAALASGASVVIPITVAVAPGTAAGTLTGTVSVAADTADDDLTDNTASAVVTVGVAADLALTRTADRTTVDAGSTVTTTLTVVNNGPSTATGVVLTDPLPVGVVLVSATGPAGVTCAVNGSTVSCPLGSVSPGQQVAVAVVTRVATNVAPGSTLTDTAVVSATSTDPSSANNTAAGAATVTAAADLAVTSSAGSTPVTAGGTQTYTVRITNNGPSDAGTVVLDDPVSAGLTIRSGSTSQGTCAVTDGALRCAVGTVAAGGSITATVLADVASTATGTVRHTSTVGSATTDPAAGNNSATVTVPVVTSADLSLTGSSDPATIVVGSPVTYRFTVTNNGPSAATGVIVTDPLPAGLAYGSSADGCTAATGTVSCPVGSLTVGQSRTVSFVATTAGGAGTVTNSATVSATTADPASANNTATVVSSATVRSDLRVTAATGGPLVAGGPVSYTLTATNGGPSAAVGTTLTTTLPTGVAFSGFTGPAGVTCSASGGAVTCALGTVPAGQAVAVVVNGTLAPTLTGASSVTTTVTGDNPDPNAGDNTATSTVTVNAVADVGVTLAPVPGQTPPNAVTAGTEVRYTLTVTNSGPSTAVGVVATGQVPPNLTPVLGSSAGACTLLGGTVTCSLGNLPPGATLVVPLVAVVNSAAAAGDIPGSAQVGSNTPDPTPANNTGAATITVVTRADLTVGQTIAPDPLTAGGAAVATVTVTNNGPSEARDLVVTDVLDAALTPTAANTDLGACTLSGRTVTCTASLLGAGSSLTIRIPVTVAPSAAGTLTSTATVSSPTDPDGAAPAISTNTVGRIAALRVTGSATPEPVVAGGVITTVAVLTNEGPSDATDVSLSAPVPLGMGVLSVVASDGGVCTVSDTELRCTLGTVAAGDSRQVVVRAATSPETPDGTPYAEVVTVDSPTPDTDAARRTTTLTGTVVTAADVAVGLVAVGDLTEAGTEQDYLISVTHNGPSTARAVVLDQALPTGTTFVAAVTSVGTCTDTDGTLRCDLGDLAPGTAVTVQLSLRVSPDAAGSTLSSTATVSTDTTDPTAANNTATVDRTVTARSDLKLIKTLTSGTPVAGATAAYDLAVTNPGPSTATNVTLTDVLPTGTTLVSATAAGGGSCVGTTTVTCRWPSIGVGPVQGRTATVVVRLPSTTAAGANLTNSAAVRSDSFDNDPASARATSTAVVTRAADLRVDATLAAGTPIAGNALTWQFVVTNDGPSAADGVTVSAPAPAGVTFTASTTSAGNCTVDGTGALQCALGTVDANGVVTVTVTGTLAAGNPGGTLRAAATAGSVTTDPDATDNTGTVDAVIGTATDLSITRLDPTTPTLTAGGTVGWEFGIAAAGPSIARNTVLVLDVPAGVTLDAVAGCSGTTGVVRCTIGDLAPASAVTVAITGTLDAAADTAVALSGTVTSDTPEATPDDNSRELSTDVATSADLTVTGSGPATVAAGTDGTWSYTVTNTGPSVAREGVLSVTLPAGLGAITATSSSGVCTVDGDTLTCAIGSLAVDGSALVTVSGTVDPGRGTGSLSLTGTVSAATADPSAANSAATVTSQVTVSSTLTLDNSYTGTAPAVPGTTAGWLLTVGNAGPSTATGVIVTDALPADLSAVTAIVVGTGVPCAVTATGIRCDLGTLDPLGSATIAVTGLLAAGSALTDLDTTAVVAADGSDPVTTPSTTPVVPAADLTVGVALTSGAPVAGAPISYTLEVTNRGPSDANGVRLVDTLPAAVLDDVATTGPGGSCTVTGGVVTCDWATVPAGATRTVTVTGTLAQVVDERLTNTATVDADTADPNPADNTSTSVGSTTDSADLALTIATAADVTAGGSVSWTLTVRNDGPSDAREVSVSALVPAGVTDAVLTLPGGSTCDPAACAVGTLTPDASVALTLSGTLSAGFPGSTLSTTATVITASADPDSRNNTATAESAVGTTAALTVAVGTGPAVVPGGTATYTVVVTNAGPSDAATATVTTVLPDGFTLLAPGPTSDQGTCTVVERTVSCTTGIIPAGGTVTVTLPVAVDPALDTEDVSLSATVTSPTVDPAGGTRTGGVTTPVTPAADLTVLTTAPSTVAAGGAVLWRIVVGNDGPSVARDIVLTDALPAGVAAVLVTSSQGSCTLTDGLVTCTLGALAPGDQAVVVVEIGAVLDPATPAGTLVNTASIASPTPEPGADPADGRSSTATTVVGTSADLAVTVTPDNATVTAGGAVGWTAVVTNDGPSVARGVLLNGLIPGGVLGASLTLADGTPLVCTENGCALGDLGPAGQITVRLTGTLDATTTGTGVSWTAAVSSDTPDPAAADNTATGTATVGAAAHLVVGLTGTATTVAGGTVSWELTVTNTGPSVATGVQVSRLIPAGVTGVTVAAPDGVACDATGTCTIPTIGVGAGAAVRILFSGTVDPAFTGTSVTASATVTGSQPDPSPNPADATATAVTTVTTAADLAVTNAAGATSVVAGTSLGWTVTVTNNGPSVARAVVLTDPAPAGVSGVTRTPSTGTCDVVCDLGDLAPGQTVTVLVSGTVDAAFTGAAVVSTATVTSGTAAVPGGSPATATATTQVTRSADLAITAAVAPALPEAGGPISWTLTATNTGPSDATDVVLVDTAPPGVGPLTYTVTGGTCTVAGPAVTCTAATLAAGASLVVVVTGTVPAGVDPGTLSNSVGVTSSTPDPDSTDNTATVGTSLRAADLGVAVTAVENPVTPGGPAAWTVTVTNSGPDASRTATVAVTVPAGITLSSLSTASGAGTCVLTPTPQCTLGPLPAGGTETITVVGTVGATASGSVTLGAAALSPDDRAPGDNTDASTVLVVGAANLGVTIDGPDSVVAGTDLTWTVTVANAGPVDAVDTVVTIALPTGLGAVDVPDGCVLDANVLTCAVGAVPVGRSVVIDLAATVDPTFRGDLSLTATATSALVDLVPTDDTTVRATPVTTETTLTVTKTAAATVGVAQDVVYTITVTNAGPSAALDAVLTEQFPAGAVVGASVPGQGTFTDGRWTIGDVLPDAPAVLTVAVSYPSAGDTVNVVSLEVQGEAAVARAEAEVTVVAAPVTGGPGTGGPGTGGPGTGGPVAGPYLGAPTSPLLPVVPGFAGGGLAYTGATIWTELSWAMVLLAAGAALLAGGRRRRSDG